MNLEYKYLSIVTNQLWGGNRMYFLFSMQLDYLLSYFCAQFCNKNSLDIQETYECQGNF